MLMNVIKILITLKTEISSRTDKHIALTNTLKEYTEIEIFILTGKHQTIQETRCIVTQDFFVAGVIYRIVTPVNLTILIQIYVFHISGIPFSVDSRLIR